MDTIRLLKYMDKLRYERNLTQTKYLEDVISQRQYYRYLKGESLVPFEVISNLAKKLNLSVNQLIREYEVKYSEEINDSINLFNAVLDNNHTKIDMYNTKFINHEFINVNALTFYKTSNYLYQYNTKKLSKTALIEYLKELINYDDILNKNTLVDIELYLLGLIMQYSLNDREVILDKFNDVFFNEKTLSKSDIYLDLRMYFWIIKHNGILNKLDKVIEYSQMAIDYCHETFSYYLLEYFYYYKALAHYKLNQIKEFEEEFFRSLLIINDLRVKRIDSFYNMFEKDFNINPNEFLIKKLKNNK